jgi:hypothetical protein
VNRWGCIAIVELNERLFLQHTYDRRSRELGDALEESGCIDAQLLGHLRAGGPHVRGCFALDAVLGKR